MKKKVFFGCVIFVAALVVSAGVFAADFELVYKMGKVETRKGDRWTEVAYGDRVPGDAPIRLAAGAVAEFDAPGGTVVFSKPGTYSLGAVVGADRGAKPAAVASVVNRMKKIGGTGERGQAAVMGVRAKRADSDSGVGWVQEDDMLVEDAAAAYGRGDYAGAVKILEKDVDPQDLQDKGAYWYILAASNYNLGRKGPAMRVVSSFEPEAGSRYHADFLFLKGLIAYEGRDAAGAAESFTRYTEAAGNDADRQMGYFLLGQAYLRLGDYAKAKNALQQAMQTGQDAEIKRIARDLMP